MPTPLISGADAPVAAGAPLFVTIPVVVEAVRPAASAPPPAGLDFLEFPRLCSDALIRRLATQRPARGRRVFDPGGVTPVSPRVFRHIALFVRPWLSARERVSVGACGREWRCWELFGDSPLSPPRPAMPYRFCGFWCSLASHLCLMSGISWLGPSALPSPLPTGRWSLTRSCADPPCRSRWLRCAGLVLRLVVRLLTCTVPV